MKQRGHFQVTVTEESTGKNMEGMEQTEELKYWAREVNVTKKPE